MSDVLVHDGLKAWLEGLIECAGTFHPLPTEPLAMPPLVLAGRLPEQHNAVINLDMATMQPPRCGGAASEITAWPEFHNGVAAGAHIFLLVPE